MADVQIVAGGTSGAPLAYTVPGAQEIIVKALFATFDGTAAGGAFLPCIRILAPGGKVVGEYITDASVAAGSSAEVSFAPFLRGAASSTPASAANAYGAVGRDTSQNIAANTQDYVKWTSFFTSDQAIFATGTTANPTTVNNTTGDTTLIFLADGAYLIRSSVIWGTLNGAFGYFRTAYLAGSPDQLNQIFGPAMANYDPTGVSLPPGGGAGSVPVKELDVRPLNIPGGVAPQYEILLVWNGAPATIHNIAFASMEAWYFGNIVPSGGGQVY